MTTTIAIKIAILILIVINAYCLEREIDSRNYGCAARITALTALLLVSLASL